MKNSINKLVILLAAAILFVGCANPVDTGVMKGGAYSAEKLVLADLQVPEGLMAWHKTPTSLTVGWWNNDDASGGYIVWIDGVAHHSPKNSYTFENLTFGQTYEIAVSTVTMLGYESEKCDPISVKMDTTLTAPTGVTITRVSDKSISIIWDESTHPDKKGYHVHYNGKIKGTKDNFITLSDLNPGTEYSITVKQYGLGSAISEPSDVKTISTLATSTAPLSTPTGVTVTNITDTTITITWDVNTAEPITYYSAGIVSVLRLVELGPGRIFTSETNSITFTDLSPGIDYEIIMMAHGDNGDYSRLTEPVFAKTATAAYPFPQWDASATYTGGELVVYQGEVYKCKWWTQGNIPGTEQWGPWEVVLEWGDGVTYTAGDAVIFENNVYICIQGHTALNNWIPSITPALWDLQE